MTETIGLITSILTPLVLAIIGYYFNLRLKAIDLDYQKQNKIREEEEQKRRDEIARRYEPHIEFTIDANFHTPQQGFYIAEFTIYANNKSLVQHKFNKINLRVRGIKKDEELKFWEENRPRLLFPHKLFETDIVPKDWNFIVVEPGVKQEISFVTKIEQAYSCLIAQAEFEYDKFTPQSTERTFAIRESSGV
jgi:hypothetical protein